MVFMHAAHVIIKDSDGICINIIIALGEFRA
jgi:hypothetical protein